MVNVPYQPYATVASEGNLGNGMKVQATPNDFGAQTGKAIEGVGKEGFEIAQKQQGMVNETLMTNADADFATKVGKIKGEYTSLSGLAAYNAFPQYQESIKTAFQESRAALPLSAQHGFDMMAVRSMANHVADGSTYAASQLKDANRDSYSNVANVNLQALLDPQVAADKERSDYHLDTIKYAAQAQVDEEHPGLKTDQETGTVSFDESTPEGRTAKAQFQQKLDTYLSQGYVNRYDTLAKHDVFGAYAAYQQERDKMPKSAQVALDSSFGPRIMDAHKQTASSATLVQAQQDHYETLTNPSKNTVATIMKNELHADGVVRVHSDGDGSAIGGINSEAFPAQFNEAKNLLETKGQEAAKNYINKFYQKDIIENNGVDKLPPDVQDVVADGLVNHWSGFQTKLLNAARDGASRSELIQMRREEYQRLASTNPEKYSSYLTGWNNRLDNLQLSTEGKKTYATNENGGPLSLADYYRTNSREVLTRGDTYAEAQMPGDLTLKRLVRQTLTNEMNKTISNETQQQILDNRNVMRAINGEFTNKKPPETEEELRTIPGMGDLLDNISARDPKFAASIPTLIEKMARRNDTSNSSNGYETVMRALEPNDYIEYPNRIASQDHLVKLLGRSDGTGINMKDYNDAKKVIEKSDKWKEFLSKNMKEITIANGDIDGKGKNRALSWYNQITDAKQENDSKGDKALSEAEFIQNINDKLHPLAPSPPSKMQQISNWASTLMNGKEKGIPSFSSPDDAAFIQLPSGSQFMVAGEKVPRIKK